MKWKFETEIEIPVEIKITNYNPGCEGSPKNGPLRSYQDIQAPEPEELEFEVYINGKEVIFPEKTYWEIYEDVLEKAREMYQDEKDYMEELKAEQKIEELQEKRLKG